MTLRRRARRRRGRRVLVPLFAATALVLVGGCERVARDMYDQPKLKTNATSPLFVDGEASRPPPPDSLPAAVGAAAAHSSGRRGDGALAALEAAERATSLPPVVDAGLLARGHERYAIYCVPCHSVVGDGDGMVVRRGFPAPPSYAIARLRDAPDRHFYDVIGHGYGVMSPYGDRIDAVDRWAIVAHIRHLQRDVLTLPAPAASAAAARVTAIRGR
jgi:mono/diheme cytochrome c family protein